MAKQCDGHAGAPRRSDLTGVLGARLPRRAETGRSGQLELLTGNVFFAGREWLTVGEEKLRSDGWMKGGASLKGFWTNSTSVSASGKTPIHYGWFRQLLQYMLDHQWYTWFGKVIAIGETLVGIGLIVGALVGIAAFFGAVLNFNFQLAGSASTNPVLFGLGVFLVLAWKVAGWWGLDRWLLPILGTPWTLRRRAANDRVDAADQASRVNLAG